MKQQIEVPLHAKSDPLMFGILVAVYISFPVMACFAGGTGGAVVIALFVAAFLSFFTRAFTVFGKRAVITHDRLTLFSKNAET